MCAAVLSTAVCGSFPPPCAPRWLLWDQGSLLCLQPWRWIVEHSAQVRCLSLSLASELQIERRISLVEKPFNITMTYWEREANTVREGIEGVACCMKSSSKFKQSAAIDICTKISREYNVKRWSKSSSEVWQRQWWLYQGWRGIKRETCNESSRLNAAMPI